MRCAIYSRVSTDAQEREGTSLGSQEAACVDYARERGWTIVEKLRDTASGFNLERPGMTKLRSLAASRSVNVILAHALDRMSRKQTHVAILVEEMEQQSVQLEFVTEDFEDTAVGQLVRSVKAFAAEFEREKIAERTMRGKRERAHSGKLPQGTGAGFYGYLYDSGTGKRTVVTQQAHVVMRVFNAFVGGSSCNGIARELNAEGIPTLTGARWHPLTVRRLLKNESYTGRTMFRSQGDAEGIEVVGATPPIVSQELYKRAAARFSEPGRQTHRQSHRYRLSGRIRCRDCASAMVGHAVHKGRYHYYRCGNAGGRQAQPRHPISYLATRRVESLVRDALTDLLANPERIMAEARRASSESSTQKRKDSVTSALADLELQQRRLIELYTEGQLPKHLLEAKRSALADRRRDLEKQLSELGQTEPNLDITALETSMPTAVQTVMRWIEAADGDDFDLLLEAVDVEVHASADAMEIRGSVPVIERPDQRDFNPIEQTSA